MGWTGEVAAGIRLHRPVCEGMQASAALRHRTGDPHWERWYRRLWEHVAPWWVDGGTRCGRFDASLAEAGTVWPGRPDVHHCGGALLGPLDLADAVAPRRSGSFTTAPGGAAFAVPQPAGA